VSKWVIEINDAALELSGEEGVVAVEPGFALIEGDSIQTGSAARARARLLPRQIYSDFWSNLGTGPISDPRGQGRSAADLAYVQLSDLWSRVGAPGDDVALAVPGDLDPERLGLLLGIARAAEIPVRAIMRVSLLCAAGPRSGMRLLHLDAGLHRSVSVEIAQTGGASEAALRRCALGLETLHQTWLKYVTARFIETTRFDPSHTARSEQALYDQLPHWVAALCDEAAIKVVLDTSGSPVELELSRGELVAAAASYYAELRDLIDPTREGGEPVGVFVSPRLAQLPGLCPALLELEGVEVIPVAASRVALAAFERLEELEPTQLQTRADDVRLLTCLSWPEAAAVPTQPARPVPARELPTHIVLAGLAHPIPAAGLVLGSEPPLGEAGLRVTAGAGISRSHCALTLAGEQLLLRDLSRYGTFVNDQPIEGETQLRAGDRIRIGTPGIELLAVAIAGPCT